MIKVGKTDHLEPIPIKKLNDHIIITDGHTRAYTAFLSNYSEIKVFWDNDDLDWEAYQICVNWCKQEGINSIADLSDRVIEADEHEVLWLKRCQEMQQSLELKRKLL